MTDNSKTVAQEMLRAAGECKCNEQDFLLALAIVLASTMMASANPMQLGEDILDLCKGICEDNQSLLKT